MALSTSRHTSGVMQRHGYHNHDSMMSVFLSPAHQLTSDKSEAPQESSRQSEQSSVKHVDDVWQKLKLLTQYGEVKPLLVSIPGASNYCRSVGESKYCSDSEEETTDSSSVRKSAATKKWSASDEDTDDENMLPSLLGGLVMIFAVALDMTGTI